MILRLDTCEIDCGRRCIVRAGATHHPARKAFELLLALIDARPNVVTKDALVSTVWPATFVSDANLSVLVADLRAALGDSPRAPHLIRTHHGVGYSFVGTVREIVVPAAPVGGLACMLVVGRRRIFVPPGTSRVGRDDACEVVLRHQSVSRVHATLTVGDESCVVEDLHSKNGTRVDDVAVTGAVRVTAGQRVAFGAMEVTVQFAISDGGSTISARDGD